MSTRALTEIVGPQRRRVNSVTVRGVLVLACVGAAALWWTGHAASRRAGVRGDRAG